MCNDLKNKLKRKKQNIQKKLSDIAHVEFEFEFEVETVIGDPGSLGKPVRLLIVLLFEIRSDKE